MYLKNPKQLYLFIYLFFFLAVLGLELTLTSQELCESLIQPFLVIGFFLRWDLANYLPKAGLEEIS
jgi:hypothetical protein